MQDDPAKLSAALEQLEAERNRRIDQRVAEGKAVYGDPIVVGWPGAADRVANEVRRDAQGREIYPRPNENGERIAVVITGVPRAGRDDGYQPPEQPAAFATFDRCEPPTENQPKPPPPRSAAQPDATEAKRIIATIPPRDERDLGVMFEGSYKVQSGQVYVYSADGKSLGSLPVGPDDNVELIARRLLREKLGGGAADFYGRIPYPKLSIH